MRRIIDYIRSCFCKHEWEVLSHQVAEKSSAEWCTKAEAWVCNCKKCGYMKTYALHETV